MVEVLRYLTHGTSPQEVVLVVGGMSVEEVEALARSVRIQAGLVAKVNVTGSA
jgi:hypothetical protein